MIVRERPGGSGSVAESQADAGAPPILSGLRFAITRGRSGMLQALEELQALARRCDLRGVLDHLAYFTAVPYFGAKEPYLLLARDADGTATGAALFLEYRIAGMPTGLFIPMDSDGERTIVAPPEQRAELAWEASRFLLQRGAKMVLCSYSSAAPPPALRGAWNRACQTRTILRDLPLEPAVDATLARMGRHTRRNLRAYRRRAGAQLGTSYLAEAAIPEREFLVLSNAAAYPVPNAVSAWRYRSAREAPGGVMAGLRAADGRWLSIVGGRRFQCSAGPALAIDWQLNAADLPSFSLGMTMQAYLLEHEVARGTACLRFEGGSSQSLRSALQPQSVQDILTMQPGLSSALLQRLLGRVLPKGNLLGETLSSGDLAWERAGAARL